MNYAVPSRLRLFTGVFGTLCALELILMGAVATKAIQNDKDVSGLGGAVALPTILLASGLATKKGWMRAPFKKYEPTTEEN